MTATDDTSTGVTEDTFDLMDWIESGTVARRQVTIHNNPALADEYAVLEERLAEAEKTVKDAGGDGPMSEGDPREPILADMEDLWAQWEASKAVWTVRALSQDDVEATFDAATGVASPKAPMPPPEKAGERARDRYLESMQAFGVAKATADRDRHLYLIAAAIISVQTVRGTVEHVSVAQLRTLRGRPHGEQWIAKLYAAVEAATQGDVEIPRPTSPVRSTSTEA